MICYYCNENKSALEKYGHPICQECEDSSKNVSTSAPLHRMDDEQKAELYKYVVTMRKRRREMYEG